jgi:hypothetical protein
MAFAQKLDPEGLQFFTDTCEKPFAQQAVAFLNAYWEEVGSQAEFIFGCAWETIKSADMHAKGIHYVHQYEEGNLLEFNIGLYFYEQLCKVLRDGGIKGEMKGFEADKYNMSQPEMLTAIKRKTEIRDKVDVNFDNKISFLEYLLYQYRDFANPSDFVTRSMHAPDEHPEIKKARLALEEVNKRIRAYEAEKARLEADAGLPGVKGLKAKNLLAQLDASPLKEELNRALITAEAAVRMVTKKFGKGGSAVADGQPAAAPSEGAIWWMNMDLQVKKAKYGRPNK